MSYILKPYTPIIKVSSFDPSPIAGKIPYFADGENNPQAIGSSNYNEFWEEQIDRCMNGYKTGGIFIPGRFYFYLNFVVINGLFGPQYPWYTDLDLDFFLLVEDIKKKGKMGPVCIKARRKGLSEKTESILQHGVRFIEGYRGAVIAGRETYVTGLKSKFIYAHNSFGSEFRLNTLMSNDKQWKAGFEIKNNVGGFIEEGYKGQITFETMFDDPTKLEGEYFHDVICEESGQNKILGKSVDSIRPALEFGSQMMGTFYIYGTGGNILSGSKDFKDYFDNADVYDLERMFISGARFYFPFFGNKKATSFVDKDTGETIDGMPNFKHLKPYERLGIEDIEAATAYIKKKTEEYSKLPNKTKLIKWKQSYPLTVEDAFTSSGNNNFNSNLLYSQMFYIDENLNKVKPYILEYVMETQEDGTKRPKIPLEVTARPAKLTDPDWKKVMIYQHPRKEFKNLDAGGIDGYNQDQTQTSKSLGSMIILRNGKEIPNTEGIHDAKYPVFMYYKRPPRKEQFYEICLMASIYYNLINDTLASAEADIVIDYYLKHGGRKYLAPRPRSFDAPNSKVSNIYGAKMTGYSKPLMISLVQSEIEDNCEYIFFREVIADALAYDEDNIGTDWDSIDAYGLAAMRISDKRIKPRSTDTVPHPETIKWVLDENGNPIPMGYDHGSNIQSVKIGESVGNWTTNSHVNTKNPYDKTKRGSQGIFEADENDFR